MEFFTAGVGVLKTLVTAIGAGLGAWGVINLGSIIFVVGKSPMDIMEPIFV